MTAEVLYEGRFLKLMRKGRWEYVQRVTADHAVIILALTEQQEIILIEQFRTPADAKVIELPAGLVGDSAETAHESLEATAHRELIEEAGYRAGRLQKIFAGPPSPGIASETITWFRAFDLEKVGPGGGDHSGHEDIVPHVVPLAEADAFLSRHVANGGKVDAKVYAGLYFLLREMPVD